MKLKPSIPFFELATIGLLVYFFVGALLDQEMGDKRFGLAGLFLLLIVFSSNFFNRQLIRQLEIGDSVIVKRFFWGKVELKLENIKGYRLKEVKRTKLMISDYNLVFVDDHDKERLAITQGDFKSVDWERLLNELKALNIEFLGQESMRTQWKGQWNNFKRKFGK